MTSFGLVCLIAAQLLALTERLPSFPLSADVPAPTARTASPPTSNPASVDAATVTEGLANLPAMLRGGTDTYQYSAKFVGGPAHLQLAIQSSKLLEIDRSTITIELDGVPLVTDSVRHVSSDGAVSLGAPLPGYHQISIVVHLRVAGVDVCSPDFREQAWLVIAPPSALTTLVSDEPRSYQALLGHWFERKQPVSIGFGQAGDATASNAMVIGYLQLDNALRSHGFAVEKRPAGGTADVEVVLDPQLARSTVQFDITSRGLRIVAKEPGQLAVAGQVLADAHLLEACAQWPCEFGELPPPMAATVTAADAAVVAEVSQQFPRGFRVAGPGQHRMRLEWNKPLDTELLAGAELRIIVRAPPMIATGRRIRLDVDLAGVVIESFDLKTGANNVRLPLPVTDRMSGSIEVGIVISITEPPNVTCGQDDGELWAWIDPEGALLLPRRIQQYNGIASYFAGLMKRPTLMVAGTLTWDEAVALAPVLAPIARKFPNEPWHLATACAGTCIQIHPARSESEDVQPMIGFSARAPYKAPSQAVIVRTSAGLLELWCATRPPEVPVYSALLTTTAISTATSWSSLGVPRRIGAQRIDAVAPAASPPIVGHREHRRKIFVWIWSGIAIVILLGLSRLVTRAAR